MAVNSYNQVQFNQYTPKSFQEMLAPVMYATEQEEKTQEQYSESASSIDKALAMLNPEVDKESYASLKKYREDIAKASEDLATKGFIDSGRKTNLYNLKKTYDTEFTDTLNQLSQRAGAIAIQQQKALQDPTYRFKSAANISIDEAKKNPNIWTDVITKGGVSGAQLQQQVAIQAEALKGTLLSKAPQLVQMKTSDGKPLLNQYLMMTMEGASLSDVSNAIKGITGDAKTSLDTAIQLKNIVDGVMESSGVSSIFDKSSTQYNELKSIANQGLFQAIGGQKISPVTDEAGMMKYRQSLEIEMLRKKADIDYNEKLREAQLNSQADTNIDGLWRPIDTAAVNPNIGELRKDVSNLSKIREDVLSETGGESQATIKELQKVISKPGETGPAELEDILYRQANESMYGKHGRTLKKYGINLTNPNGTFKSKEQLGLEIDKTIEGLDREDNKSITIGRTYSSINPDGIKTLAQNLLTSGNIYEVKSNGKIKDEPLKYEDDVKKNAALDAKLDKSEFITDPLNNNVYLKKGDQAYKIDLQGYNSTIATELNRLSTNLKNVNAALDELNMNPEDLNNQDPSILWTPEQVKLRNYYSQIEKDRNKILNKMDNILMGKRKQTEY